jgi:hypothetical protein
MTHKYSLGDEQPHGFYRTQVLLTPVMRDKMLEQSKTLPVTPGRKEKGSVAHFVKVACCQLLLECGVDMRKVDPVYNDYIFKEL